MVPAKLRGDSSSALTARPSLIHATRQLSLSTEYSLQCRRFLRARECFCSWKCNFLPKSSSVIKSKMTASNQRYEHKQAAVARPKYAVQASLQDLLPWPQLSQTTVQQSNKSSTIVLYKCNTSTDCIRPWYDFPGARRSNRSQSLPNELKTCSFQDEVSSIVTLKVSTPSKLLLSAAT